MGLHSAGCKPGIQQITNLRYDRGPTLQLFNPSTLQPFNPSTLQPFNPSTLQQFNPSTIQRFNDSTSPASVTAPKCAELTSFAYFASTPRV